MHRQVLSPATTKPPIWLFHVSIDERTTKKHRCAEKQILLFKPIITCKFFGRSKCC